MTRLARHRAIAETLTALDDARITALLGDARASIGGSTSVIEVAGSPVFVKRVALTELERRHPRSTANLFGLPTSYQYGLGSSGFGVWRELAAHELTTAWVVDGACDAFPLLHHARELPGAVATNIEDDWGAPAIRARLEAIAAAPGSIVLFLEFIPHTVRDWFTAHPTEATCAMIERETRRVVGFLRAHDLLHMDAHWGNLLTDGERVYFSDFGLATSRRFELSTKERAFVEEHVDYDERVTRRELVYWLTATFRELPAFARTIVARHAVVAHELDELFQRIRAERG